MLGLSHISFAAAAGLCQPGCFGYDPKSKSAKATPLSMYFPTISYWLRCIGFVVLACLAVPMAAQAAAVKAADNAGDIKLASHKALYEIRLASTKSGSQIVNVTGKMLYETQATCDAWVSGHQFDLFYEYADSPAMHVSSDFSTYEPFDGQSIDFSSQRMRDGQLVEELRGNGTINNAGDGEAIYSLPKGLEYDLPPGALFPMTHTKGVIEAIREHKKFFNAVIFDGSDEEGPVEVNAFIGKPVNAAENFRSAKGFDINLLKSPAYNVRLAYFPLKEASGSSDYEMNVVFHENGIISDMAIEYDDFSVTQKLLALEALPDDCPGKPEKN